MAFIKIRNFKTQRPDPGTRILAYSPCYPIGHPDRVRMVTVIHVGMDEVVGYMTLDDLEAMFAKGEPPPTAFRLEGTDIVEFGEKREYHDGPEWTALYEPIAE